MAVYAVKRCCASPGCPNLVERGYCPACRRSRRQRHARFYSGGIPGVNYGRRWGKARARFLAEHPLCVGYPDATVHAGLSTMATEVDHVEPHRGDYAKFWDESNWAGLCDTCHGVKTARETGWQKA